MEQLSQRPFCVARGITRSRYRKAVTRIGGRGCPWYPELETSQ